MIRFAHPEYLFLLILAALAAALIIFSAVRKRKLLNALIDKVTQEAVLGQKSFYKEYLKYCLAILAFVLIVLGFANPQIGTRIEEVKQVGIDVMICLDVSMSMKAEDLKPNRLELAKREISDLIKKLQGDRIGLIVFAGDAFVQFPLTSDYSAANLFLNAVDVNSVPQPGTAIAAAVSLANKSFEKKASTRKVIVIITDGEDHEGNITDALKEARDNGAIVYAIGMGSPGGAPIPIYNERGNQVGFKQNSAGETVLTKLDENTLMQIAGNGGGKYYPASPAGKELQDILRDLSSIEKSEYGAKKVTDYEDKFYYFLIPAFLLLLIEFFISDVQTAWLNRLLRKLNLRG